MKILMDLLIFGTRKPVSLSSDSEPPYRLYACQANVMYSRPQFFDGETCYIYFKIRLILRTKN